MKRIGEHCRILWTALGRFWNDHGPEHAGNMAYVGLLALFPYLIFLVAISGLFGQTGAGRDSIAFFLDNLQPQIGRTIRAPLESLIEAASGGLLTTSLLFGLWSAIIGVEAARSAVIHAYGGWEHAASVWRRLLADLLIVIGTALAITLAMSLILLAPVLIDWVEGYIALPAVIHQYSFWGRYVLAPIIMFLSLLGIYKAFSPRLPSHRRFFLPGAILTLIVWLAIGKGMAVYIRFASSYDLIYGGLAGVVLLLLFLYSVASAFILGAHLNAAYSKCRGQMDIATES